LLIVCLLVLLLASPSAAQEENNPRRLLQPGLTADSLGRNRTSIVFDKSLNTYHWVATTVDTIDAGPYSLQLNEQYLSTLIRSSQILINDNQSLNLRLQRTLSDRLRLTGAVTSFVLSDNRGIGISNTSSHAVYGGVAWLPAPFLTIEPLVGSRFDTQRERLDRGPSYWLTVSSTPFDLGGYRSDIDANLQYDRIDPRTQESYAASVMLARAFDAGSRNALQLQYYRNRRDFYAEADPVISARFQTPFNIESRADNLFSMFDTLEYSLSRHVQLSFQGNVFTRSIDRSTLYKNVSDLRNSPIDSHIGEFRIEGSSRASFLLSPRFTASGTFFYQERDEQHALVADDGITISPLFNSLDKIEQRKNNHSRRTSLVGEMTAVVSGSDTVTVSGSANLLRYDTPSSENDDDRDELLYVANVTTRHRIGQHLSLSVSADVSLLHLVYLFSTRSADNTWNRILRLSPRVWYRPSKEFATSMNFEVLANYLSYDFEYLSATVRSFVFRQFSFVDSTRWAVSKRIGLNWFSQLRLYERGELHWEAFSEKPVNEFHEKMVISSVDYALTERLLSSLGIRYFSQVRYGFSGPDKTAENYLRSVGPMSSIGITVSERTALSVKGWYERLSQTDQLDRSYTTIVMLLSFRL
jgi:hypothetical protein